MIQKLNLNDPALIAERRALIEQLEDDLSHGIDSQVLCADYQEIDRSGARPGFANVTVGYLSC